MFYNIIIVGLNQGPVLLQRLCRAMGGAKMLATPPAESVAGKPRVRKRSTESLLLGAGRTVSEYVQ